MNCPRCQGTGDCPECKGKGSIDCLQCNGSGEVFRRSHHKSFPCSKCQGKGTTPCSIHCSSCNGKGVIEKSFQQEQLKKYRPTAAFKKEQKPYLTPALITLSSLLFFCSTLSPQLSTLIHTHLTLSLIHPWQELWRWWSTALLHGSWLHLLMNILFLLYFLLPIEKNLRRAPFLLFCLLAILSGTVLSYLGNVLWLEGYWAGIGLSGLGYGAYCYYYLLQDRHTQQSLQGYNYFFLAFLALGLTDLFLGLKLPLISQIDHFAHLGGALVGILFYYSKWR